MNIFITGASGYIGGSVAAALMAAGHQVSGLVRSNDTAAALAKLGMTPVYGTLDDTEVLAKAAHDADVTVNAANARPPRRSQSHAQGACRHRQSLPAH